MKEEGVGAHCSKLRKAGQAPGAGCSRIQEGTAVRTPWQCISRLTALPEPSSVPSGCEGCQGCGDCRGLCRPEGGGGREEGDKYSSVPLSLLPSHLPSLLRIPEMLGSTPRSSGLCPPCHFLLPVFISHGG